MAAHGTAEIGTLSRAVLAAQNEISRLRGLGIKDTALQMVAALRKLNLAKAAETAAKGSQRGIGIASAATPDLSQVGEFIRPPESLSPALQRAFEFGTESLASGGLLGLATRGGPTPPTPQAEAAPLGAVGGSGIGFGPPTPDTSTIEPQSAADRAHVPLGVNPGVGANFPTGGTATTEIINQTIRDAIALRPGRTADVARPTTRTSTKRSVPKKRKTGRRTTVRRTEASRRATRTPSKPKFRPPSSDPQGQRAGRLGGR